MRAAETATEPAEQASGLAAARRAAMMRQFMRAADVASEQAAPENAEQPAASSVSVGDIAQPQEAAGTTSDPPRASAEEPAVSSVSIGDIAQPQEVTLVSVPDASGSGDAAP